MKRLPVNLSEDFSSPPTFFDKLMGDFLSRPAQWAQSALWQMSGFPVDLVESEKEYVLQAEIPGLKKDDIKLNLAEGRHLTISGEKKQEKEGRDQGAYYSERSWGSFQRTLTLPRRVNQQAITATYENGVLKLVLPKADNEKANQTEIKIS